MGHSFPSRKLRFIPSRMPLHLSVPNCLNERRKSEGNLVGLCSNSPPQDPQSKDDTQSFKKKSEKSPSSFLRSHEIFEVLRKNYDLVSALADIDSEWNKEDPTSPVQKRRMKGPIPRISAPSPRPFKIEDSYCKCDYESSSISSTESDEVKVVVEPRWKQAKKEVVWFFSDIIDAFDHPANKSDKIELLEEKKLSAVQLKKDIKRCYTALQPFIEVAAALYDLLLWKNPIATLLLTLVYMYSIVRGWTASLVLLLILLQLTLNYLYTVKKIDIGLSFLPRKEVSLPKLDMSGAQLILDIAKIAQHLLRFSADFLEKLNSLLTWKDQRVSTVFYYLIIYWLALSLLFNTGTCLGMCGMTIGIRIFITTYLFDRFPRLRLRLDTYGWFYRYLPVKNQQQYMTTRTSNHNLHLRNIKTEEERIPSPALDDTRRSSVCFGEVFQSRLGSNFNLAQGITPNNAELNVLTVHHPKSESSQSLNKVDHTMTSSASQNSLLIAEDDTEENEQSSIDEDPLIDNVVAFRSCVMNEKDKTFPMSLTSGILYLTDAAIIFRAKSAEDAQPMVILFHDIISVKKMHSIRSFSLFAGTRKGIELLVAGRRKPLRFAGMAQRDDFFTRMSQMCEAVKANTYFADD